MRRTQVGLTTMSENTSAGDVNIIQIRCIALCLAPVDGIGGCANSGS